MEKNGLALRFNGFCLNLNSFFIFFTLISPLVRFVFGLSVYLVFFSITLSVVVALFFKNYFKSYKLLLPGCLLFLMSFYVVLTSPGSWDGLFFSLVSLVSYFFAYWLVFQDKKDVCDLTRISLIVFYMFFLLSMVLKGVSPGDVNKYYEAGSQNIVSATALFFQVMYSASYFRLMNKLPVVTPFLTFSISVFSLGRSGIVLGFILLGFTLLKSFVRVRFIYGLLFFIIASMFFIVFYQDVYMFLGDVFSNTKIKAGFDTPRLLMVQDYLSSLNLLSLFSGQDLSTIPSLAEYDNNPHNSFIYGHSQYGFLYLFFLFWVFSVVIVGCFRSKRSFTYSFLFLILIIRLMLDKISLPGLFDFVMYYLLFLILFQSLDSTHKCNATKCS